MFVVAVNVTVASGCMDRFMPPMLENARASERDEPGCRRFDVCVPPEGGDEVFLYEVYDDESAFDAHRRTAHYAAFAAATDGLVASKSVRTLVIVEKG